jgi:hypothetical protein
MRDGEFESLPLDELDAIMGPDGIHFTPHGLTAVAQRIARFTLSDVVTSN